MAHLHLVPAPDAAPPPRRRRGRASSLSLSAEEVRHLRASIRGIVRMRYASLSAFARDLGVDRKVLTRSGRPHPGLAVAVARLTRIPVEVLLSGKLAIVGPEKCPTCGGPPPGSAA